MDLQLTRHLSSDGQAVVRVRGELDLAAVDAVEQTMDGLIRDDRIDRVVIDLEAARFLDAAGVGALVRARNAAMAVGVGVTVEGAVGMVETVLRVTGTYDWLTSPTPPALNRR